MAVEVFIESELQELVTDAGKTEEWRAKVEELHFEGQQSLLKNKRSPLPFPIMNNAMLNTYGILCPSKSKIEEYRRTTMPTRVLEMIGLCFHEQYFQELHVWYNEESADPILVGTHEDKEYLVARWGDELRSFSELQEIATQRRIKERREKFEAKLRENEGDVRSFVRGELLYLWG